MFTQTLIAMTITSAGAADVPWERLNTSHFAEALRATSLVRDPDYGHWTHGRQTAPPSAGYSFELKRRKDPKIWIMVHIRQ